MKHCVLEAGSKTGAHLSFEMCSMKNLLVFKVQNEILSVLFCGFGWGCTNARCLVALAARFGRVACNIFNSYHCSFPTPKHTCMHAHTHTHMYMKCVFTCTEQKAP
jgi:hypothetical protein